MSRRLIFSLVGLCVLLLPVMLWAADEGDHAHGPGLTDPMMGTAGWAFVVFLLVCAILSKVAWGPIVKALDQREERIKESLEAAERMRAETARLHEEHEKLMADARKEATSIVEEGKRDAGVVKDTIIADAKREATSLTERATTEIQRAKELAIHELHTRAVEVSYAVAEKLIKKSLSREDQDKLVTESLERYSSLS